ncbi:MAG: methyltransferase [Clostridia bacterium]|nr:methyltransferase [Clostridia bacterium]MBQ9481791.1 methyltransferase [Clostridia bacterium]
MEVVLKDGERIEELFLGGAKIIQSENLYRFTSDAVLLTKFARAKKNEKVADFCSGSGIVGLHFYFLNKAAVKEVKLFELQAELAEMSERSVKLNGLEDIFGVYNLPVQEIGKEFNGYFSIILCNPPYEEEGKGEKNLSASDAIARHEGALTLEETVRVAALKLKYGGRFCIVHRADRLVDLLFYMRKYGVEPKRIRFAGAKGKTPYSVYAEGVKGGKPSVEIEPPFEN